MINSKIRVIIVDDSVIYRSQIQQAIANPVIEIVAKAANGKIAIEKIKTTPVDLIILDLEMPEMNGIDTLRELKRLNIDTKVIVFSSASKSGAESTLDALELGAIDFIPKPGNQDELVGIGSSEQTQVIDSPMIKIQKLLIPKIKAIFPSLALDGENFENKEKRTIDSNHKYHKLNISLFNPKIVVIGASTGGPAALEYIFSHMNAPLTCPILITQHMPPLFTATLAERIEKISGIRCVEAKSGMIVEKNCIYIAPGNFHMIVEGSVERLMIRCHQGPLINSVRPAIDPMFDSIAKIHKQHVMGVILTGMGADGKVGSESIKENNGFMLIQDEKTCVVYGMPRAVFEAGSYDAIMNLQEIASTLSNKICIKSSYKQSAS